MRYTKNKFLIPVALLSIFSILQGCVMNHKAPEAEVKIPFHKMGILKPAGMMNHERSNFQAIKLKNGKVLVLGRHSLDSNGDAFAVEPVELFDPAKNQFDVIGQIKHTDRDELSATLLNNGQVFILVSDYVPNKLKTVYTFSKSRAYLYAPTPNSINEGAKSIQFAPAPCMFAYGEQEVLLFRKDPITKANIGLGQYPFTT